MIFNFTTFICSRQKKLKNKNLLTFFENRDLSIAKKRFGFLVVIDHHIVITLREKSQLTVVVETAISYTEQPVLFIFYFYKLINGDTHSVFKHL